MSYKVVISLARENTDEILLPTGDSDGGNKAVKKGKQKPWKPPSQVEVLAEKVAAEKVCFDAFLTA